MISLHIRPEGEPDWDLTTFDGENEELLAHLFSEWLVLHGWEVLEIEE